MITTPRGPITADERFFLASAVDVALLGYIGDSLPYMKECKPITTREELARR